MSDDLEDLHVDHIYKAVSEDHRIVLDGKEWTIFTVRRGDENVKAALLTKDVEAIQGLYAGDVFGAAQAKLDNPEAASIMGRYASIVLNKIDLIAPLVASANASREIGFGVHEERLQVG